MRKPIVALALSAAVVTLVAGPLSAATPQAVSGSGNGSVRITFGVPPESPPGAIDTLTEDGSYASAGVLGTGSYHFSSLVFIDGVRFPLSGTATLTRSDGATLSGGLNGSLDPEVGSFTYSLDLTGTGALAGATLEVSGFLGPLQVGVGGSTGSERFTFTGTVTANVTPPTTDACKHGGWRNFVDDHGRTFRSQGQCVSWAMHHVR
jgi:hypothetical protein